MSQKRIKFNHVYLECLTILLVLCFSGLIQAAEISYEGKIVDSIVIENRNIFDLNQDKYNKFIYKAANRFHIITQKNVIKREVLLSINEPYSEQLAEETARILRQRFVLYDAWIEKELYDSDKLLVRVVTIDQWSLSAGVEFRLEGDEKRYKIGAREKNFFGLNRLISFYHISQTTDENYVEGSFIETRLFGKKLKGLFSFSTNPKDKFRAILLERPYFDLQQQFGFGLVTKKNKGRIDNYINDSLTSQTFYKGSYTEVVALYRVGSYTRKFLFTTNYIYNYEVSDTEELLSAIDDSTYHLGQVGFEFSDFDFKKLYNIDGFNYTEDFNSGLVFKIEYAYAYTNHQSKLYNKASFSLRKNYITEDQLFVLNAKYVNWYNSTIELREFSGLNFKYFNQSIDDVTFALNLDYRADLNRDGFNLLNLGGKSGLRGADEFLLTGDQRIVLNSEVRILPKFSIASFSFGGVLFGDFGNIIQDDKEFRISETYASFGIGLRAAFDKSSKNILRLDFAYSRQNGWQFSLGSGQYFNATESI